MKLALGLLVAATGVAQAHFDLVKPDAYSKQDGTGSPQKSPPCGQADPGSPVVETGLETTFAAGDTITITVDEKIFHPGHYRVSIAQDMGSLPADPTVMAGTGTPCGTADVMATPVLPVLADNLLVHTSPFSTAKDVQVTLPAGLTCAHCVLQVVEFMSDHPLNNPGGCFYHHCAKVSVTGGGVDAPPPVTTPTDAPTPPNTTQPGGCAVGGSPSLLLVLGLIALRRRRR